MNSYLNKPIDDSPYQGAYRRFVNHLRHDANFKQESERRTFAINTLATLEEFGVIDQFSPIGLLCMCNWVITAFPTEPKGVTVNQET